MLIFVLAILDYNIFTDKNFSLSSQKYLINAVYQNIKDISYQNSLQNLNYFQMYSFQKSSQDWTSTLLWYLFELKSNLKITKYANHDNNFVQINSDEIVYLYCGLYESDDSIECIDDFNQYMDNKYVYIKTIELAPEKIFLLKRKNSQIQI